MVMDEDSSVGNWCTDFFRCHAAEHVSWCSTCNRTKKLLNPADISFSLHEASGYFQFYTLFLYRLRKKNANGSKPSVNFLLRPASPYVCAGHLWHPDSQLHQSILKFGKFSWAKSTSYHYCHSTVCMKIPLHQTPIQSTNFQLKVILGTPHWISRRGEWDLVYIY